MMSLPKQLRDIYLLLPITGYNQSTRERKMQLQKNCPLHGQKKTHKSCWKRPVIINTMHTCPSKYPKRFMQENAYRVVLALNSNHVIPLICYKLVYCNL